MLKTKVLIFNKKGKFLKDNFHYGIHKPECTNTYSYLGINFTASGSLKESISTLSEKGLKAMYKLNNILDKNYDINTVLHIFDHTVKPILLYASEVWGVELASSLPKEGVQWIKILEKSPIPQI